MRDGSYHDDFSSWADVVEQFETTHAEPEKVLHASYTYENYSGDADVAWLNPDGSIGYVSGSHCSCYGLEGQFDVETYSPDVAHGMLVRSEYAFGRASPAVREALAA